MENVYLVQCKKCKTQNTLIQEYERGPLICQECGTVDDIEEIKNVQEKIDDLAEQLTSVKIQPQAQLDAMKFAQEFAQQQSLQDLFGKLRVKPIKRKRKKKRRTPYSR
jgi:transcription initiation factor TFIIIB Brf1 subunit/transcription initiation factor TFIIB